MHSHQQEYNVLQSEGDQQLQTKLDTSDRENITESLNKQPHAHTHQKHGIFTASTAEMKQMYSTHITGEQSVVGRGGGLAGWAPQAHLGTPGIVAASSRSSLGGWVCPSRWIFCVIYFHLKLSVKIPRQVCNLPNLVRNSHMVCVNGNHMTTPSRNLAFKREAVTSSSWRWRSSTWFVP